MSSDLVFQLALHLTVSILWSPSDLRRKVSHGVISSSERQLIFFRRPDYHRYHSPVDGVIGKPTRIEGQYYTVNPQAIRTTLDVYGENVREVWPIQSPQFGTVMTVWIGAMSERRATCRG